MKEYQEFDRRAWLFLVNSFLFYIVAPVFKSAQVLITLFTEVHNNYFENLKEHSIGMFSTLERRSISYIRLHS